MSSYLRLAFLLFSLSLFTQTGVKAQLYINEWLASNENNLADEFGEFDDWIEIYNDFDNPISLAGYYLSDDATDLTKWQIPTSAGVAVEIPAKGFILLWADKDTEQGDNHLDFKLSGGGEDILLVESDGTTIVDQVDYPSQGADVSYGRFPDAGGDFQYFPIPTPLAGNFSGGNISLPVNIEIPISMLSDDGTDYGSGTTIDKIVINLGNDSGTPLHLGLRFQNLTLDPNIDLDEVYIQFTSAGDASVTANYTIQMEETVFAETLMDLPNNVTGRNYLPGLVSWVVPDWTNGSAGLNERTPNLAPLFSQWISQPNWEPGGNAFFKISGDVARVAHSFENLLGEEELAAKLIIRGSIDLPDTPITGLKINEVAAAGTSFRDEEDKAEDWLEVYNESGADVKTTGLFLTDDKGDLDKWSLPTGVEIGAQEFYTVWVDNDEEQGANHANFSLRSKGEWVGLVQQTTSGFTILDSLSWDNIPHLASFGRNPDGGSSLQLFGEITPNASNVGAEGYLETPNVVLESGKYAGTQTTEITHPENVVIRYTLDGSLPSSSSTEYTGPISISSSSSVRAIATKSGFVNSLSDTKSYLIDDNIELPVLLLTTDPDNFFDPQIGIYVDGDPNVGSMGYCSQNLGSYNYNWATDWWRPINAQLVYPDNSLGFDTDAGAKISGACSRNLVMKSFAISTDEQEYGEGKFSHSIFPERDHNDYYDLKVRNSGQDWLRLGFRDLVNQRLIFGKLDVELQAGISTLTFINGEFWGIYNLREKYTKHYFEENFGANPKKLDIIKSPGLEFMEVKHGAADEYMDLFTELEFANFNNPADYQKFTDEVDVNNFISYWSVMIFLANYDWPGNNITVWKERKASSKWRYCVADTDGSTWNFLGEDAQPWVNTFELLDGPVLPTVGSYHKDATRFIRKAWAQEEFSDEYAQRTCSIMDIIYPSDVVEPAIDSMVDLYDPYVARQLERWLPGNSAGVPFGGDKASWLEWIGYYKDFFKDRPAYVRDFMRTKFELGNDYKMTFNVTAATKGSVAVNWNEMKVPFNHVGTYYQGTPLRITAIPQQGFSFVRWDETGDTNATIEWVGTGDQTLTPIFEASCVAGESCDDGDECTENDVFDALCDCVGEINDIDMDGIPDGCDDDVSTYDLELVDETEILLFPNPTQQTFFLQTAESVSIKAIRLFDYSGREILLNNDNSQYSSDMIQIEPTRTLNGVHLLQIILGNGQRIYKRISFIQ